MDEILFVQVINRKTYVHTGTGIVDGSLVNQLDTILTQFGYARLNDNTIVNLAEIKHYDSNLGIVYMDVERTISINVSRRNRYKVIDYLLL